MSDDKTALDIVREQQAKAKDWWRYLPTSDELQALYAAVEREAGEIERLRADRDSWAQQADDRVKDAVTILDRAEKAEARAERLAEIVVDLRDAMRFARTHLYAASVQFAPCDDAIIVRHIEDAQRRIREVLQVHGTDIDAALREGK